MEKVAHKKSERSNKLKSVPKRYNVNATIKMLEYKRFGSERKPMNHGRDVDFC